jgi:phosphatidylethanolamine-binding protein (PEBP) family uncharacterized protein
MVKGTVARLVLGAAALGIACAGASAADKKPTGMTLSSASFKNGRPMPKKFGASVRDCGGQNISPALAWSNVPANTKSFALTMFDPDGRKGLGVVHWVAYDIAAPPPL